MGITQRDDFNFFDGLNKDYIVIESNKLKKYIDYINRNQINSVAIHESYYYKEDLNFMKECHYINSVNILSPHINDYSGLDHLENLKVLYLSNPKSKVDVSKFSKLTHLYVDVNKNVIGLDKCHNLKVLKMWNFKPQISDLESLSSLNELEQLEIVKSNIVSLKGIDNFSHLSRLGLYNCIKLEDISSLKVTDFILGELTIESCKKILDYSVVKNLNKLKKLWLTDNGEIDSISFISNLRNLELFVFMGTTVLDGDLNACANLNYVAFDDKKHYSHKFKDFQN